MNEFGLWLPAEGTTPTQGDACVALSAFEPRSHEATKSNLMLVSRSAHVCRL